MQKEEKNEKKQRRAVTNQPIVIHAYYIFLLNPSTL